MKYLLLICDEEKAWGQTTEADRNKMYAEYGTLIEDLSAKGKYLGGSQLQPTNTAKSVRVRAGKRTVVDGPFAETREQFGGYFLVEVKDESEAIEIAARIPSARVGTVEVRPLVASAAPASA